MNGVAETWTRTVLAMARCRPPCCCFSRGGGGSHHEDFPTHVVKSKAELAIPHTMPPSSKYRPPMENIATRVEIFLGIPHSNTTHMVTFVVSAKLGTRDEPKHSWVAVTMQVHVLQKGGKLAKLRNAMYLHGV